MPRVTVKPSGAGEASAKILGVLLAGTAAWIALTASASAAPRAHAAHSVRTTDTAHLNYNEERSSGSWLYEEGAAGGTLPGNMRANCNITATLTANFTIYVHGGTINGHASAAVHGSGLYQSFGGYLEARGGTGRYAHAHGRGGFYGVLNRNTYNMTVQTTGTLSY
jgi:hypothetical protein